MVPKSAEREIARTEIGESMSALPGGNGTQQTQLGIACPDDEPAACAHAGEAIAELIPTITVGPRQSNRGRSGAGAAGDSPARDGSCLDRSGMICPQLAEALDKQALAERQRIEMTHRLVNALQIFTIRIERQRRMHVNPALQDELGRLAASARASAQLHRYLLPPSKSVDLDIGELLGKLATAIEGTTGLRCDVEVEALIVSGHVAADLAAAVNELAWNAFKHGYGGAEGGVIRIICRRHADARLLVSVADRGRGLPTGFDPHASKGLGLMVVLATARQFGGEVQIESDHGTCFSLLLPILHAGAGGAP